MYSTAQEIIENEKYAVITISGMRGSGKSYLASHLDFTSKVDLAIYIDVVGAFKKERQDIDYLDVDFLPKKEQIKHILNKAIEIKTRELIFDISYLSREEMVDFIDLLSEVLLQMNKKTAVIIDEVGEILEQEGKFYSHGLERLVRIGRNKNVLFVVMITQRLQKVNKHAIALSDYYVFFKTLHNLDRKAIKEILGYSNAEFKSLEHKFKDLKLGQYIITNGIDIYEQKKKIEKQEEDKQKLTLAGYNKLKANIQK